MAEASSPNDRDPKEQRPMAPGDQAPAGTPGTGEDVCPRCGGSGRLANAVCTECGGRGKVVKGIGGG
ncbi:hypothetical protein [Piscinibacter sp. XHJ-5]|uniref:hypothetical protein n=1 Tax=Piscinibacter sp. XHJ-5 TaxID=3037797 RepID=UPI002452C388|nr:hypothetical protein [Piscinibacter sp. XHJ-5]